MHNTTKVKITKICSYFRPIEGIFKKKLKNSLYNYMEKQKMGTGDVANG
jgi:hypothetical protein